MSHIKKNDHHQRENDTCSEDTWPAVSRRAVLAAGAALGAATAFPALLAAVDEDKEGERLFFTFTGPTSGVLWPVDEQVVGIGRICLHGSHMFASDVPYQIWVKVKVGLKPVTLPSSPEEGAVMAACLGTAGQFVFNDEPGEGCNAPLTGVSCSANGSWNHALYWARRFPTSPWAVAGINFKGHTQNDIHCASEPVTCPTCPGEFTKALHGTHPEDKPRKEAKPRKEKAASTESVTYFEMQGPRSGETDWQVKRNTQGLGGSMCVHGRTTVADAKKVAVSCVRDETATNDPPTDDPNDQDISFVTAVPDAEGKFVCNLKNENAVPVPRIAVSRLLLWVQGPDDRWRAQTSLFKFGMLGSASMHCPPGSTEPVIESAPVGKALKAAVGFPADDSAIPHSNAQGTISVTGPSPKGGPWQVRPLSPVALHGRICLHGYARLDEEVPTEVWVMVNKDFLGHVPGRPRLGAVRVTCLGNAGEFVFNDLSDDGPLSGAAHAMSGEANHVFIWAKFASRQDPTDPTVEIWDKYGFPFEGVTSTQLHCFECDTVKPPSC